MPLMMRTSRLPAMLVIATSMGTVLRSRVGSAAVAAAFRLEAASRCRRTGVGSSSYVAQWLALPRPRLLTPRAPALGTALFSSLTVNVDDVERMRLESENEMRKLEALYGYETEDVRGAMQRQRPRRPPVLLTTPQQARAFMREIDTVLFDCDGVLYRWPDPVPGAKQCIQSLLYQRDNDGSTSYSKAVYFVTNNAGTSRRQLCEKLNGVLGLSDTNGADDNVRLTEDMMISSSYSAARYLQLQLDDHKLGGNRLYVIGSLGLCQELEEAGFVVAGGGPSDPSEPTSMTREELASYDFDGAHGPIHAVVVGHDTAFNFRKLCVANVLLQRNPEAILVATNEDAFDLVGVDARHIPGNGCVVRALEHSSRRKAVNVGKPSTILADLITRESRGRCVPSRTVIVGDRLDTDIKFGRDTGMHSLLVMTGVTTADYLRKIGNGTEEEPLPTHIVSHVGLLV